MDKKTVEQLSLAELKAYAKEIGLTFPPSIKQKALLDAVNQRISGAHSDAQVEEKDVIEVPKAEWDKVKNDIARLTAAADKSRLSQIDAKKPVQSGRHVRISHIVVNGKRLPVVAWRMVKNEVYQNTRTGAWHEEQEIEITTVDGTKTPMSYTDFLRLVSKDEAEVVGRSIDDRTGDTILSVILQDGSKLDINVVFVN